MARPLIAFLTDFGIRDHYVGAMKGVVLGICPDATLVDITHDIAPHDVLAGALELAAAFHYFPAGAVFVVVIDPGVGSQRRAIAVETRHYMFVAPDNGVLTAVLRAEPAKRAVELTERKYARPTVSRTFEGRDRFAPAAAWLAKGVALASLGREVKTLQLLDIPVAAVSDDAIRGEVLRVDRFGNLITNIPRPALEQFVRGGTIIVRVADHDVPRVVATYAEARPGEICALFGSTDHLEVAVNGASAAEALEVGRGAPVNVTREPR